MYEAVLVFDQPLELEEGHGLRVFKSVPGVALLRACRLISTEASGILYSRNAFHFASYSICNKWLRTLGTQRKSLRNLRMDFSCRIRSPDEIDITALVEQLRDADIRFVPSQSYTIDMALSSSTSRHIRLLAQKGSSVAWITIRLDSCRASFWFSRPGRPRSVFVPCLDYALSETDELVRVASAKCPPNLLEVWRCHTIRENILSRLGLPPHSVTFDLDRHTTSQAPDPVFGVSHAL